MGSVGPPGSVALALTASALVGYRQNYTWWLGTLLRAGPFVGPGNCGATDEVPASERLHGDGSTLLGGLMVEAVPFLGPFARFYAGPVFWARYITFSDSTFDLLNGSVVTLRSGWTGGVGLHFGTALGSLEQRVLSFAIYTSKMNTQTIFFAATIGFQPSSSEGASRRRNARQTDWPGSPMF